MALEDQGFLSPDVDAWRITHTHAFREEFQCAWSVNRTAMTMMRGAEDVLLGGSPSTLAQRIGRLYHARLISNFEGALLLAETGMIVEARALTRLALETSLYLLALAKCPDLAGWLSGNQAGRDAEPIAALFQKAGCGGMVNETGRPMASEPSPDRSRCPGHAMAEAAGLRDLYHRHYHQLSWDAVHPAMTALDRYLEEAGPDDLGGLAWGPAFGSIQLGDTLHLLCRVMLSGCVALNDLLGEGLQEVAIQTHWAAIRALTEPASAEEAAPRRVGPDLAR